MTTAHAREWNLGGTEDAIAHILGSIAELDDYGSLTDAANVLAAAYVWESKYSAALLLATNIEAHQVQLTDRIAQVIELESSTGALALRELVVHIGDKFREPISMITELIEILEASRSYPLFPLGCAAIRIEVLAPRLANVPGFQRLTTLLDDCVAQREGNAAAAENRRRRAHVLYATGDVPNAIRQLQTAKHSWYGSGRLEPTVDCLFDLADWYLELGLPLAAKYNAQTACGLLLTPAGRNEMGLLGDALQRVMMCDFRQGAWLKVADMGSSVSRRPPVFAVEQ